MGFHCSSFHQPSSLLFIFTSLLPLAKTEAACPLHAYAVTGWALIHEAMDQDRSEAKEKLLIYCYLLWQPRKFRQEPTHTISFLKRLLCFSCSSDTLQLSAAALDQHHSIPRKIPSKARHLTHAQTHHACAPHPKGFSCLPLVFRVKPSKQQHESTA